MTNQNDKQALAPTSPLASPVGDRERVARVLAFLDGYHGFDIHESYRDEIWAEWPVEDEDYGDDESGGTWPGKNYYYRRADALTAALSPAPGSSDVEGGGEAPRAPMVNHPEAEAS